MRHFLVCFLIVLVANPALATDWRPKPEAVREICERLTDPLQRSILLDRHGLFRQPDYKQRNAPQPAETDINNDGTIDDLTRTREYFRSPGLESSHVMWEGHNWVWPHVLPYPIGQSHDDLRETLQNAGEINVLELGQHRYVLVSNDRAETDLMLLAIIGPDWQGRLLCRFEPSVTLAVTGFQWPQYWPYCLAIADRNHLPALEVQPVAEDDPVGKAFEGGGRRQPEVVGEIVVDIFNTGEPVRLLRLDYPFKRRAGCPVENYVLAPDPAVPEEEMRQRSDRLMQAQRAMQPPRDGCPDEVVVFDPGQVDLVEWRGQVLVHAITPRPHSVEFVNRLYRDDKGKIAEQSVCMLTRVKRATISELNLDWLTH